MQKTVINIGDRIDMTHVKSSVRRKLSQDTYASSVLDYDGRRMMRISAPMFESKLIPVQIEDEYELCIYTSTELYKTRVKIVRRFREGFCRGCGTSYRAGKVSAAAVFPFGLYAQDAVPDCFERGTGAS